MRIRKVLIVDDNRLLTSLVEQMLEPEGYEIRLAEDCSFGYLTYLLFRPDLIITDIHMPHMNGLELVGLVRRHEPGLKTIYMSGDLALFDPLLQEEKSRHHAGLLEKPFTKAQLMGLISGLELENDARAVHRE